MKELSPFSRKPGTEFNRTKIQTKAFKEGDVSDCGDQAPPPERSSGPQFLPHSEAWARHVRGNYRWHAHSMLITQPLGLPFMEFRPNVTRMLQSSKTDAVSCMDCLRFVGRRGGDTRSQVHSAFCSVRRLHLLDLCLFGGGHFSIQTKQREQVQRDSVHLNN